MVGSKNYFSSTTISVAGGQANGVNYMLDGGDHNDSMTNVNMPIPFPDALQEFSVQTSSLPARFGLHPGAVVNAVTKSGTNHWHESLRVPAQRRPECPQHLCDRARQPQAEPVWRHRRRENHQRQAVLLRRLSGNAAAQRPAADHQLQATPNVLNGDFSAIESAGCVSSGARTLRDPSNGQPFAGNQIPVSRFNQQAVNLITKYVPVSNDPCGRITYGIPATGDEDQFITRVDWVQNSKHTLYGRYFLAQDKNPPVFDGKNALTTTAPGNWERAQTVTLGDTYAFSGATLNAFHATFSRRRDNRDVSKNDITPKDVGLKVYAPTELPAGGRYELLERGLRHLRAGHFNTNSWHFADDVDVIRGKHQMSFGVDYLQRSVQFHQRLDAERLWTFDHSPGTPAITWPTTCSDCPAIFSSLASCRWRPAARCWIVCPGQLSV